MTQEDIAECASLPQIAQQAYIEQPKQDKQKFVDSIPTEFKEYSKRTQTFENEDRVYEVLPKHKKFLELVK